PPPHSSRLQGGHGPDRRRRPDQEEFRNMSLTDPFTLCIIAIVVLAFLGLPMGLAMIGGSILYLAINGLDMGLAAEQFLNGMYSNYIILAVPLFVLAAEIMNSGTLSTRLLEWCNAIVGRFR